MASRLCCVPEDTVELCTLLCLPSTYSGTDQTKALEDTLTGLGAADTVTLKTPQQKTDFASKVELLVGVVGSSINTIEDILYRRMILAAGRSKKKSHELRMTASQIREMDSDVFTGPSSLVS
jgi:triacylglycerol esterase/lipase EstA (alpha/beta hydrolase family)